MSENFNLNQMLEEIEQDEAEVLLNLKTLTQERIGQLFAEKHNSVRDGEAHSKTQQAGS